MTSTELTRIDRLCYDTESQTKGKTMSVSKRVAAKLKENEQPKPKRTKKTTKKSSKSKTSEPQRGASAAGFHSVNLYQNCERKHFLRTIARLEPIGGVAYPLLYGTAIHEAKDVFYKSRSAKKAKSRLEKTLRELHDDFETEADFEAAYERAPIAFDAWLEHFGYKDLELYDILGVEKHVVLHLGDYKMTARIDLIIRSKITGDCYIVDTKTAGFSKYTAEAALHLGDQATTYIYAARYELGIPVHGLIGDILYWNKQSNDPNKIECFRTDVIQRDERQLAEWKLGMQQKNAEMAQKASAVITGHSDPAIFTRNTHYCMSFFRRCEFADICRQKISAKGKAPAGFRRNPKIKPLADQFFYDESEGLL